MEYTFKPEFINILKKYICSNNLYTLVDGNKYTIMYILDLILTISTKINNRYRLPDNLSEYLLIAPFTKYSIIYIKEIIRKQIVSDDKILDNYIIIGKEVPEIIDELTVTII